jgi:phosphate transport system protein
MRNAYFDQLDSIVSDLVSMTREVQVAVRQATKALLTADAEIAEQVISEDALIDETRDKIEVDAFELLALQQPVAKDLRMLVAAKVARLRVPDPAVPEEIVPTIERMASVAEEMVGAVADIIAERDVDGAMKFAEKDEEMDQLRRSSFRLMLGDDWQHGVEPAVDIALLGRYYERIADHAVSLARRVVYLVTGENISMQDA